MKFHKRPRMSYWATSNFALKLQGKEKVPRKSFATINEVLEKLDQPKHWIESLIDKLQDIYTFPVDLIYSIKIHYKNCKGNTHVLDSGLEKGVWYDLDYRISQCLFYELDKFITQEKGLEAHEWEKTLTLNEEWGVDKDDPRYGQPSNQALAAMEQEAIWTWWKENKDYHDRDFVSLEQDEDHRKQEDEMLIRLIKIRGSLWS